MKTKILVMMASLVGLVALSYQGCSGMQGMTPTSNSSLSTGGQNAGLEAFQSGLYSFAVTQGCNACHAAAVAPFFASATLSTAYAQAETIVNFSDPSSSLLIAYSGNNHCAVAACENTANPATVTTLLQSWSTVEISSGGGGGSDMPNYVTATIAMPTTIPLVTTAKATPVVINFQLSALQPAVASLSKAILQIEVEMENSTTYRISNPIIGGNTASVSVSGIHVYIRPSGTTTGIGTEGDAPANLWNSVASVMAPVLAITSTNPTTPLTGTALSTQILFVQQQSTADSITIGFDNLQ